MAGALRSARRRDRHWRTHAHNRMEANEALPAFAGARRSRPRNPGQRRTLARADPRGPVTVSDRPEDRPVPSLARASARNARTRTAGRTDGTSTERRVSGREPAMRDEDREAIRQAGAQDARRSRARQGLPERIEDPVAVAVLAAILHEVSASRSSSENSSNERKSVA